jgi:hypothetical protein
MASPLSGHPKVPLESYMRFQYLLMPLLASLIASAMSLCFSVYPMIAQNGFITRNLRYVISEFCRFSCRWRCPQGRAEQYITFFLYAVSFFGCIPGKINCSKGLKSKEYKRKKCLDFWVAPFIESQGRTCRSGHYELYCASFISTFYSG